MPTQKIVVLAELNVQESYSDLCFRLSHHFSHLSGLRFSVFSSTGGRPEERCTKPKGFEEGSRRISPVFFNALDFFSIEDKVAWKRETAQSGALLIFSESLLERLADPLDLDSIPHRYLCDRVRTRKEGGNMIQAAFDLLPKEVVEENRAESARKFLELAETLDGRFEECHVLATGPSIENYKRFPMDGTLCIASNSSILNRNLVRHAKPAILVFADPVFHFGVSQYAGRFRKECAGFLRENPEARVVLPMRYYALMKSLWPQESERLIGMPWVDRGPFNFRIDGANFFTRATDNILTLLLLPLATSFCKRIKLIGCDGRRLEENTHFWGHGQSVQLHPEMESVRLCHPGFFRVDYNDYYLRHCETLREFVEKAEARGFSFTHCGASHIPVLKERESRFDPAVARDRAVCTPRQGEKFNLFDQADKILEGFGEDRERSSKVLLACAISKLMLSSPEDINNLSSNTFYQEALRIALDLCSTDLKSRYFTAFDRALKTACELNIK